ncbi:MAG: zinc-binding dehydrogenase, partial [Betaproteobacteria bacterium]|nr:zinc-binding dehydrogenase [Betaproteobacteria bacterium]
CWRLDFRLAGQLRNLHWRAVPRREPGPGEVEIAAVAAGLNFRDVMYAMGLLADEAVEQGFAGASLGLEVAGRILRCGPGVQGLQPGDEVLAFAGASFASHVVVPAHAVARKPAHWSFAEAATVPTVFFTVWYALRHLAQLRRGERVLVHGAAGGVGLAAIQVAHLLGAEVYASAGSPAKREFLRLLGVAHVLDSRDPGFDQEVLRASSGQGVDVVLNSLAGEAITRNLQCLKPFGRFIELGKRDFYENTPVGLRPFRNNLSYFGVDADQLMQLRPELARDVFAEVMRAFADGRLHPLPHRVFDADHVVDAFRHMQQARQIGKVVLDLERPPRDIRAAATPRLRLRADATYLVSGGLGGFGLATARWLAERGARHLALLGRRGADTPGLQPALDELREQGVQVRVLACDIT